MKVVLPDQVSAEAGAMFVLEIEFPEPRPDAEKVEVTTVGDIEALDLRGTGAGGQYEVHTGLQALHVPLRVVEAKDGEATVKVDWTDHAGQVTTEERSVKLSAAAAPASTGSGAKLATVGVLLAGLAALGIFVVPGLFGGGKVPDVAGQGLEAAVSELEDAGYKVIVDKVPVDDSEKDGVVLRTEPESGAKRSKGATVHVQVGSLLIDVVSTVGYLEEEAVRTLNALGLNPLLQYADADAEGDVGKVIEQSPTEGDSVPKRSSVKLLIGRMPEAGFTDPTTDTPDPNPGNPGSDVPDIPGPTNPDPDMPGSDNPGANPTGDQPTPADPTGDQPTPTDPTGDQPTPTDPTGDQPTPTDPTGDQPTPTNPTGDNPGTNRPGPDAPGGDQPTPANPTGDQPAPTNPTGDQPAPTNPTGDQPTSTNPTGDQPAPTNPTGDQPDPTNPTGDQPQPDNPTPAPPAVMKGKVPNLVGQSRMLAQTLVRQAGLRYRVRLEETSDKPDGTVLGQEPAAGTELKRGERVTLYVAKRPLPKGVIIPDVVGQTVADATKALRALGFLVRTEDARSSGGQAGTVVAVDPPSRAEAPKRSWVILTVAR